MIFTMGCVSTKSLEFMPFFPNTYDSIFNYDCNIRYTSKMLLAAIDERHRGTYDFIYLPIDFKASLLLLRNSLFLLVVSG